MRIEAKIADMKAYYAKEAIALHLSEMCAINKCTISRDISKRHIINYLDTLEEALNTYWHFYDKGE